MKHEKSCGTIIINQDKVLLIGSKDEKGELFWSFPKGHQEPGETDAETALRETLEEVGLDVEIVDEVPIITSHSICDGAAIKDIYLFLAKFKGGEVRPQPNEVDTCQWINVDETRKYLTDHYQKVWSELKLRLSNINMI